MNFSNFIKALVESTTYNFGRGERDWQNFIADYQIAPSVYLDEPISSTFEVTNSGAIQEVFDLKLVIMHKSQLDWTPEQHSEVIELARQEARKLTILLNNSDVVKSFTNPKVLEYINLFDSNVSGVFFTCQISFYDNASVCVNGTPQSDFVHLLNTNNEWQRTVPNGSNYIVPNTPVELVDSEGTVIETVMIPSVSGGQIVVTVGGSITVSNSNNTYSVTTSTNLELPNTTVNVFVDGVLSGTGTIVTLDSTEEINVLWT
jgi:hypothetical protein